MEIMSPDLWIHPPLEGVDCIHGCYGATGETEGAYLPPDLWIRLYTAAVNTSLEGVDCIHGCFGATGGTEGAYLPPDLWIRPLEDHL